MANIDVTFISVGDEAEVDVELDDQFTGQQVTQMLIQEQFLRPLDPNNFYQLTIKGRATIGEDQSLAAAGARTGDEIRVNVSQRGGRHE
jgi:hypothetical protein